MPHKENTNPENKSNKPVVARFAPSPTGLFHIGSARTALFNDLFVRQNDGKLVLRIEDTDKERNDEAFEENIIRGLEWLGIHHNEFYRQSERTEEYQKHLRALIDSGHAYISKEETGERDEVIRFKNPGTEVVFDDLIRGEVKTNTADLGDFVIAKDMETPLYHLAVSVDDFEMGITHVIRGEDGISNTARQILIQEALGAERPTYAHIPLILASDRSKLSKRHGAISVEDYHEQGYLPEAIINFLGLLGWNPGTEQELFSHDELVRQFDITRVQKGGAMFNIEKLNWFNKEHIKNRPQEENKREVRERLEKFYDAQAVEKLLPSLTPILLERINVYSNIEELAREGELDFYFTLPEYETEELINKKERPDENTSESEKMELFAKTKQYIDKIIEILQKSELPEKQGIEESEVKDLIWNYASDVGRGSVLWPMRYALSGKDRSPDPFTLVSVLGYESAQARLQTASQKLAEKL